MSSWWLLFASDFAAFSQTEKSLESLEPGIWDEDVLASVVTTAFNFGVGKSLDPFFQS